MSKKYPKVSVIIPCYKTEKYIERCLDSVVNQTYRELEIICVNDGSGDEMKGILKKYANRDKRIKVINNEENIGLFSTRLVGIDKSTGDYISFVDSDDYIEPDYYRQLVFDAIEHKSDIVFSNICRDNGDEKYIIPNYNKEIILSAPGKTYFDKMIKSFGRYYRWHVIWDKLISREIWNKSVKYFKENNKKHFIMCEDVVFSTFLLKNAKTVFFDDDVYYFYCENKDASTSSEDLSETKIRKNLNDIIYAFDVISGVEQNNEYRKNIKQWRDCFLGLQLKNIIGISKDVYDEIRKNLKDKYGYTRRDLKVFNSSIEYQAVFNDGGITAKQKIIDKNIKTVSFDVFDTLIVRPFYVPSDLFEFLNEEAKKILNSNGIMKFSDVRIMAEELCRKQSNNEDVKLDEIYNIIINEYKIDEKCAEKLKKKEIDLELKYCSVRKYGKQLYDLALYLNKNIIIASDMYLQSEVIKEILRKNGYTKYDKFYLSCECGVSKHSGTMFKKICNDFGKGIVHIDDSVHNCSNAEKNNIIPIHLLKSIDAFNLYYGGLEKEFINQNYDRSDFVLRNGVRVSLAIIANKICDNPFCCYVGGGAKFNMNPYIIGYYALGMHLLALDTWLLEDSKKEKLDTLCFMARDGYMPYKTIKLIQKYTNINKETNLKYIYASRKATVPLSLSNGYDFLSISTYFYCYNTTPNDIVKMSSEVIELPDNFQQICLEQGFKVNRKFKTQNELIEFTLFLRDNFYDKNKMLKYKKIVEKYYDECFRGKSGNFDIGYSGKPELLITNLLQKPIITYFIHGNFITKNNFLSDKMLLKTFYDYTPVFTGVVRELLFSSIEPSCIGFKENEKGEIVPIFKKKTTLDKYSNDMIASIQGGAYDFAEDFLNIFADSVNILDFDKNSMSIPFEYLLHYSCAKDRLIFRNIYFDDNEGHTVKVDEFWSVILNNFNKNFVPAAINNSANLVLPQNRCRRILFYIFIDPKMLTSKMKEKFCSMSESPNAVKRLLYCIFYDRRRIINKIRK